MAATIFVVPPTLPDLAIPPGRGGVNVPSVEPRWASVTASTNRHYVASRARSPKVIERPPGFLSWDAHLGTQPPLVRKPRHRARPRGEEARPPGTAQLQQAAGEWVTLRSRSQNPQLSCLSWWRVKQRWVFSTESCPNCRFVRKKIAIVLPH